MRYHRIGCAGSSRVLGPVSIAQEAQHCRGLMHVFFNWYMRKKREKRTTKDVPPPLINGQPVDVNLPSLYTAVQEQLGLRLDSSKGPVEVLLIDSVSRPTEN